MKKYITHLCLLSLVFMLASCAKSDKGTNANEQGVAINVDANIATKADGIHWDNGDQIGITMFKHGALDLANGNFSNCRYVIPLGEVGKFLPYDEASTIYFPQDGSQADFSAYYPYTPDMQTGFDIPINLSNQQVLKDIDFMTAEQLVGISKHSPLVNLHFKHRLSKIIVNLKTEFGDSPERLDGCTVTVSGMMTQGNYTLLNSAQGVIPVTASVADMVLSSYEQGRKAVGIVMPRTAAQGVVFQIKLQDGSEYTAYMAQNLILLEGYQYVFDIKLLKTPVEVSADIQPWSNGPETNLTAVVVTTPAGASSGVVTGDKMLVYANSSPLGEYAYNGTTWIPTFSPIYWESIQGNSIDFAASLEPLGSAAALNNTQLPDYRIAKINDVARNSGVDFEFQHIASQVVVELKSSDGSYLNTDLAGAAVTLPNYFAGGYLNGYTFVPGTIPTNILFKNGVALIQPQTITGGSPVVVVTINGIAHTALAQGNIVYIAGQSQKLIVDVLKSQVQVSATVTPWVKASDIDATTKSLTITTPGSSNFFVNGNTINFFDLTDNKSSVFTYNGSQWSASPVLYWDDLSATINVAATYLIGTAPVSNLVPCVVASDQSSVGFANSDFLVAYISSLNRGYAANLPFKHAMSKLNVVLAPGVGFTAATLAGATVKLNNQYSSCMVNVTNLAVSNTQGTVDVTPYTTASLNFSAMIVPNTFAANKQMMTVTINGTFYPVALNTAIGFVSNQVTTITVTVNKTPIGISCTLQGWIQGDNGGFVIQ